MELIIHKDGSFESVAAVDYKQKIADSKMLLRHSKEKLRDEKKALRVVTTIARMKNAAKTATPERKEKIRSDITKLRMVNGVGPKSTLATVKKAVARLEKAIVRETNNIDKWKKKITETSAKLKGRPAAKTPAKPSGKLPAKVQRQIDNLEGQIALQAPIVRELKGKGKPLKGPDYARANNLKQLRAQLRELKAAHGV